MSNRFVVLVAVAIVAGVLWVGLGNRQRLEDPPRAANREVQPEGAPEEVSQEVLERFRSTGWARELDQSIALAQGSPRYEPGSKTTLRPFDDSDPEMQALMKEVYSNDGCARPGEPCEAATKLFGSGGDRLARYLIVQFNESIAAGYPNRLTYLSYIAYTNSDEGFRFIASRVRAGPDLDLADYQNAARALAHTGHPDALPEAVRLLEEETDLNILSGGINTLWRVPIATGDLEPWIVERLVSINSGELSSCGKFCAQRALDGLFSLRNRFDLPELDDFEPAIGRLPALWHDQ